MAGLLSRAMAAVSGRSDAAPISAPMSDRPIIIRRGYPTGDPRGRRDDVDVGGTYSGPPISPERVRDACRRLTDRNPHAIQAVRVLTNAQVGHGITPKFPNGNKRAQKLQEKAYRRWTRQCDHTGSFTWEAVQWIVAQELNAVNEVFVRLHVVEPARAADLGLEVPLQVEVIRSEQVTWDSFKAPNGNRVVEGIELDAKGRRVAAWVYGKREGDSGLVKSTERFRLPLFDAYSREGVFGELLHIRNPMAGSQRGRSRFEGVRSRLQLHDRYTRAILARAEVEACFAGFKKKPKAETGYAMPLDPGGAAPTAEEIRAPGGGEAGVTVIEPGTITELEDGEEITFSNPQGSGGLKDFSLDSLRTVSAGAGVPYEFMTNDLSQVSYISLRGGLIPWHADIVSVQWHTLIPDLIDPVLMRWNLVGYLNGRWEWTSFETLDHNPPRLASVDPVKDLQALIMEIEAGITPLDRAMAERGEDYEKNLERIAAVKTLAEGMGLTGFAPKGIGGTAPAPAREGGAALQSEQDDAEAERKPVPGNGSKAK